MLIFRAIFFTVLIPGTVTVVVPWLLLRSAHPVVFGHPPWRWIGLLPLGAGIAVLLRCIWDFAVAGRGTLAPIDPPTHLVVRGLYRYVRNPMYLGVLCILSGEAILFTSLRLLIYASVVFLWVHGFVAFYEEPTLRRQFGQSYERYTRAVHRWLPRKPLKESG